MMLHEMSDSDAILEATIVNLQLTKEQRDEVLRRMTAAGHGPNEHGQVGPRMFVLMARKLLGEEGKDGMG